MKSLLYHAFGVKGFRYLRTRYEAGEIIFEVEPEKEPEVPAGQKLRRHGYRWRTVRSERLPRRSASAIMAARSSLMNSPPHGEQLRAFVASETTATPTCDMAAQRRRLEAQLERLKVLQTQYFAELLEGAFDAAYFEKRLRVGQAHQRVGLEPVYYLGAYNQYVQLTFPLFAQALAAAPEQALSKLLALIKVIFLDIGLALDTYFQEATRQLRERNE